MAEWKEGVRFEDRVVKRPNEKFIKKLQENFQASPEVMSMLLKCREAVKPLDVKFAESMQKNLATA
eukprot:5835032-Amphidinium_carterae.1